VHHHTIQIIHQLNATIFPVFYLTFIYSSTCFGRPHAHHRELKKCSNSLWFYLSLRGDNSAVGRGRAGRPARPRPTARLSIRTSYNNFGERRFVQSAITVTPPALRGKLRIFLIIIFKTGLTYLFVYLASLRDNTKLLLRIIQWNPVITTSIYGTPCL
jgi:hypothetical protein